MILVVRVVTLYYLLENGVEIPRFLQLTSSNAIYFGITNEIIEKLAKKLNIQLSRKEIGELAKKYIIDLAEGKTNLSKKERLEEANLKIKEAIARIKEWEADHLEIFEKKPSSKAKEVIKTRAHNALEYINLKQFITIKNDVSGFKGICDFCKWETVETTTEKTLNELSRHLTAVHSKEILQK